MNGSDYSAPPRGVPVYVKYLLGLPQDCTREELANEWTNQVAPLMAVGPQHLWNRESQQLMAAGVTGPQAQRILKQTKRGQFLFNSAEREGRARLRQQKAKPPFQK